MLLTVANAEVNGYEAFSLEEERNGNDEISDLDVLEIDKYMF